MYVGDVLIAACGDEDESGEDGGGSEDFATQADANRQEAIDLSGAQIARLKEENTKAVEANAPDVDAAFEAAQKRASDLGLANCASELPSDDADASEAVLREFLTTADPATSCDPDALVMADQSASTSRPAEPLFAQAPTPVVDETAGG